MKALAWICGVVVAVFVVAYLLLFSSFGNSLLKGSIEKYASNAAGMEVRLDKFELGFSDFDIIASLNNELSLSTKGKYSLLGRSFELVYSTQATSFMDMKIDLSLIGQAKGKFSDFVADGSGTLAGSNIRFAANLKDYAPAQLRLDAKNLDLAAISLIALKKPLLHGKLSAVADIIDGNGTAKISAPNIMVDSAAQKEFGISLPKNFSAALNSDIKAQNNLILAATTLKSPIAQAGAKQTSYDIATGDLKSDFNVNIADLSKLEPIIHQKLSGSIKVDGNAELAQNQLKVLEASIKGLGGEIIATLKDGSINADIKSIKLASALALGGLAPLANADINGVAKITDFDDISKIKGDAQINLNNGVLNHKQMNAALSSDLKADVSFDATSKLNIANSLLNFDAVLNSPVVENLKAKGEYKLNENHIKANINAKIASLSAILGSNVAGGADLKADVEMKNSALSLLDVDFKGFGGSIFAKSKGKDLQAQIKNIQAGNLFALTSFDKLLDGVIDGELSLESLDINNLNGRGELKVSDGVFNQTAMKKLLGGDFPAGAELSAHFKPTFTNSVAYFSSNIKSDLGELSKFDGSYNISKNALDATYSLSVKDLAKLAFLTGTPIKAPLNVNGKISTLASDITASATSDIFSSKTNIKFEKNKLNADIKEAKIEQILKALDYGNFYQGVANARFNYDILAQNGDFDADILKGQLVKTQLTDIISTLLGGRDITHEIYENGKVIGTISKGLINFNANLNSERSKITANNSSVNTNTKALNIPLRANYEKTDFSVDITGTTENPKYKMSSNYLEQKAAEGIGKILGGGKSDDKDSGSKNLLKGLKSLF